jgi:ABC-type sugar transport system ATPase subunit
MADVRLRGIKKSFGKVDIIHGVDLDIEDGEFCVFVGPSGCGKSTLLRLVAGLEDITSGDLMIDGDRVNEVAPKDRGVAMVFQSYALYPHMSVYENMAFGLQLAKTAARAQAQAAFRRSAPAGRDRPGHRPQAAGVPLRRALVEPGRRTSRADAYRACQAARRSGRHHDLRDP